MEQMEQLLPPECQGHLCNSRRSEGKEGREGGRTRGEGRRRGRRGKGRGEEDPLDLFPPGKFASYATAVFTIHFLL